MNVLEFVFNALIAFCSVYGIISLMLDLEKRLSNRNKEMNKK